MSTNQITLVLIVALVLLWQPVLSETTGVGKYRVSLNNGERFVLSSARLTSDSLIGTTFNGVNKSVPIRSIYSLDHSNGTHVQAGAGIGVLLGVTCALVSFLHSASSVSNQPQKENSTDNIPLKLLGFVSAGGLLGLGIGSTIDKWEPVLWSEVVRPRSEINGIGLQFSLYF